MVYSDRVAPPNNALQLTAYASTTFIYKGDNSAARSRRRNRSAEEDDADTGKANEIAVLTARLGI